jgi:hypothetical protein
MLVEESERLGHDIRAEENRIAQASVEVRAGIDTETVKALQLINGGLAAGLVTMLPSVIRDPNFRELGSLMVVGIMCAVAGLVAAVIHNRLRRKCSLEYTKERSRRRPPFKLKLLVLCQTQPGEPHVCTTSIIWMWASLLLFVLGAVSVGAGFWRAHTPPPDLSAPCWELQHIGDHVYKFNRCTGMAEAYTGK